MEGLCRQGSQQPYWNNGFGYEERFHSGDALVIFILQYVISQNGWTDFDSLVFVLIGFGLFYVMLFVLPEQLVILYCKFRFKSFNYYIK